MFNIYKEAEDTLDMDSLINDFITRSDDKRRNAFAMLKNTLKIMFECCLSVLTKY